MIKIENHKHLHPKLWTSDGQMKPQVKEELHKLYVSVMSFFSSYTRVPMDLELDVADVVVGGSCAEYFYTKKSDLDMKIVVKYDRYKHLMDNEIFIAYTRFIRIAFMEKYAPKIAGIDIDIGITNKVLDMPHYSVLNDKWIIEPKRFTSAEVGYLRRRANLIYKVTLKKIMDITQDKKKIKDAGPLYSWFKDRRGRSWNEKWKNKSPFSIAYSHLSRGGYIEKLVKLESEYLRKVILKQNID